MPLRPCSPASSGHTRERRWGLRASFQGDQGGGPTQSYLPGPAGWGKRGAGLNQSPRGSGVEQDKVEAGCLTGQTGVWGGGGTEGGRERERG